MKINIICSEANNGWIYSKFIKAFQQYSTHHIYINSKEPCDIVHYLPYYETPTNPSHPCSAWFSHQELKEPLKSKFLSSAKQIDFAFVQAKKYGKILDDAGIIYKQVVPGCDDFKPRIVFPTPHKRLIVGYVGRGYTSSNRKNPGLLAEIGKLPWIDLRITGGKIKEKDLPEFYRSLDLAISPSLVEGGPLCLTEGLGSGIPVLCFAGVGMADEFDLGVWKVKPITNEAFIKQLYNIWKNKLHEQWYNKEVAEQTAKQVGSYTYASFVKQHDLEWQKLKEQK